MIRLMKNDLGCPILMVTTVAEHVVGQCTFQELMLIIGSVCTGITIVLSLFLTVKHLYRYTVPEEQRQIIRIVLAPVVFACVSLASIGSYSAAPYLKPIADLYEAYALASLFLLLVLYVSPDAPTREEFFLGIENTTKKGEVIPGGSLRWFNVSILSIRGPVADRD